MRLKKYFFTLLLVFVSLASYGQKINAIIPHPASVGILQDEAFLLDGDAALVYRGTECDNSVSYLKGYLKEHYGLELKSKGRRKVELKIAEDASAVQGAYSLQVLPDKITVTGYNEAGLFYGVQTLLQLLPVGEKGVFVGKIKIPAVEIEDAPAFEYRGMHLDVARHIMPVEFVKRYIDYMALHKLNYFHWHLTDDQGWRIESRKHPRLNEVGSYRDATIIGIYPGTGIDSTRYGGYYTFEQIREIVDYAAKRYITIVPEIDLPGHCMSILATYPHLGTEDNGGVKTAITWGIYNKHNNVLVPSEETFAFLEDVFGELMDLFPGKYIHIGADECSHKWWKNSPKTQKFIADHNLGDEKGLQGYFAKRVTDMVRARGRIAVGWDEVVDNGVEDGVAVMVWRGGNRWIPAADGKHEIIMTPSSKSYLNYKQRPDEKRLAHMYRLVSLDTVYNFDPTPSNLSLEQQNCIIGGQGCMWTEYFATPADVEYAIFPRISAVSEVYWTREELKDYSRFFNAMPLQFRRYEMWGVKEPCRYIFEQMAGIAPGEETKVAKTDEDGD